MVLVGYGMRTGAHLANWALKAAGFSCSTTTAGSWFQSLTVLTASSHDSGWPVEICSFWLGVIFSWSKTDIFSIINCKMTKWWHTLFTYCEVLPYDYDCSSGLAVYQWPYASRVALRGQKRIRQFRKISWTETQRFFGDSRERGRKSVQYNTIIYFILKCSIKLPIVRMVEYRSVGTRSAIYPWNAIRLRGRVAQKQSAG